MSVDMGTLRVEVEIENPAQPGTRRKLERVLVDTGAELSWVPSDVLDSLGIERYARWRFRQADGTVLERWTGAAFIHVAGKRASDDVVFGEADDLVLLGSRSLEGLNLRVEPVSKMLVDAGPARAAAVGDFAVVPPVRCHPERSEGSSAPHLINVSSHLPTNNQQPTTKFNSSTP